MIKMTVTGSNNEHELTIRGIIVWYNYDEFMYEDNKFSMKIEEYDIDNSNPYWGILPEDFKLLCTHTNDNNLPHFDNNNYHCRSIKKKIFARLMHVNPKRNGYHYRLYNNNYSYNGDNYLYDDDWSISYHVRKLYENKKESREMFIVEQQKKMLRVFDNIYKIEKN